VSPFRKRPSGSTHFHRRENELRAGSLDFINYLELLDQSLYFLVRDYDEVSITKCDVDLIDPFDHAEFFSNHLVIPLSELGPHVREEDNGETDVL
jgi:hypothetical protein